MVLCHQSAVAQRPLERQQQAVFIERFFEKVDRPLPHRVDGNVDAAVGGDDHHRRRMGLFAQLLHQREASHLWHIEIGHDEVSRSTPNQPQRFFAVLSEDKLSVDVVQQHREDLAVVLFVFSDHDAGR